MAESLGDAVLELRTDNSAFNQGIDDADRKAETFVDKWAKFDFAKQILEGLKAAFDFVVSTIGDFIESASESEDAVSRLNLALKNSSQWALTDSQALQDLASAYQEVTKATDEEVMGAERTLIAFGATREMLPRLLKATLDLAAGMGIDIPAASTLLAKAMNGNTTALEKMGIQADALKVKNADLAASLESLGTKFGDKAAAEAKGYAEALLEISRGYGDTAKKSAELDRAEERIRNNFNPDVLAAVKKYGDEFVNLANKQASAQTSAEKLNNALDQINQKFGGAAAAEGNTFSGLIKRAANAWDDFKEAMGRVVTDSPVIRGTLDAMAGKFRELTAWVENNKTTILTWVQTGVKFAEQAVVLLLGKLEELSNWAGFETLAGGFNALKTALADVAEQAAQGGLKIEKIGELYTNVKDAIESAGIVPIVETESAQDTFNRLKDWFLQTAKEIGQAIADGVASGSDALVSVASQMGSAAGDAIVSAIMAKIAAIPGLIAAAMGNAIAGAQAYGATIGQPSGGSATPAPAGSDVVAAAINAGQSAVADLNNAMGSVGAGLGIPMPFVPEIVMSPPVPFKDGVATMRTMVKDVAKAGPITFGTNLSSVLSDSANWSKRFGNSLLPTGAFDILSQGLSASPGSVLKAISEARGMEQFFTQLQNNASVKYAPTSLQPGVYTPSAGDQALAFSGIVAKLQALYSAIERQNAIASDGNNRQIQAAERSASASENLVGVFRGGLFGAYVTSTAQSVVRQQTGSRNFIFGGS